MKDEITIYLLGLLSGLGLAFLILSLVGCK